MLTLRAPLVLLLLAAPGLFTPVAWWWLLAAVAVTAVAIGGDLLLAGAVGQLRATRAGDRRVRSGESATVTLTLHNRGVRPVFGRVRDAWVPSAGAASTPAPAEPVLIPPGEVLTVTTVLRPRGRGERPAGRVTVRSYGPLRLAYRQTSRRGSARLTPQWSLRVLPPFHSRRLLPEKLSRLRALQGLRTTHGRGHGTEFDSLREYVVGDDIRSIDWRATARAEHVTVKTWRPERDRRVLCVLDTGRTSAARVGDEPRLDAGIDAALLLANLAVTTGDRVDLLAMDQQLRASLKGGHRSTVAALMDGLATLSPTLVETDYRRLAAEVLSRAPRRCLVVLFTTLEPAAFAAGLLPVLPSLRARHLVVVASVADPAVPALAAQRGEVADIYTAAAATRTLATSDRLHRALDRYGVPVVSAPPERFASAVADVYLDLKAAGRL
ncbi:DUF58 domain-containing protein [Natronosporangium hydrolyticum]|uniref:DUF58 domain-containing protein n=1 Tax=Natronosporangium hydrolyticum TaxID=2811111 RepID=A0A895YPC4_9ACTN|nr:DUF58 domain-containing protein [Natronosporangium hydrolyticum]QSB15960.1 DUF58 domain-containing protein [Natronosporangium hydrolyticum]